ncbi:pyrroloquinoline quinone biosynthesis protein PqqF [Erwinia mallotivora]|uniref:pyrroloquinoline quinone biosynthesis protein PqqF n=1 Tax=Erwinia mallotivora TaxID=69222 RepID=UPI0004BAB744|nr:pyrroloquinoline quinone biosynthesis protein PqqF [Erwinia mallotivora]
MSRQLRLENGLRVTVIHDADAPRAAALIQLAAGSHQEPQAWPGLAHLLEHVLFAGSANFQHQQRLMAWAAAQGASLNATTLANQTAWFFESAAESLADGLERLVDMLINPLLSHEATAQEARVIDAEYRMLCSHSATLRDAALSQAFAFPHPIHNFHVGSLSHFGHDSSALRQALQDYHQRWFHTANLHLWLLGPQPLTELTALAQKVGRAFQASPSVMPSPCDPLLRLRPERTFALHSHHTALLLSFPLSGVDPGLFSILRELLHDKAEHSLAEALRQQCDNIQLLEPYRSPHQSLLSVVFQLNAGNHQQNAETEALFGQWLKQAASLTGPQLAHYARLAQRDFAAQSPVERLRILAFGFAPPEGLTDEAASAEGLTARLAQWRKLLTRLSAKNMTRLWLSAQDDLPHCVAQGFTLSCGPLRQPARTEHDVALSLSGEQRPAAKMRFHQPDSALPLPVLPATSAPLQILVCRGQPTLLLTPRPGQWLSEACAAVMTAALQPAMADCRHRGGDLRFVQQQGVWLLQLSAGEELMLAGLAGALSALNSPSEAVMAQAERAYQRSRQANFDDVAVRCLLHHLQQLLHPSATAVSPVLPLPGSLRDTDWQAALYAEDQQLSQPLARLLSAFPAALHLSCGQYRPALPDKSCYAVATRSDDAAVIVFCPLAELSLLNIATCQLLATLYGPRFFQRFRVEKNIGYVVSCRFQHLAGHAGLLFALQSPLLPCGELYQHIASFVQQMIAVIATLPAAELEACIAAQQRTLAPHPPGSPAQCVGHWQHQRINLPPLTPDIYPQITLATLRQACLSLSDDPQRWWHLHNQPGAYSAA